jgi:hypothetical protein
VPNRGISVRVEKDEDPVVVFAPGEVVAGRPSPAGLAPLEPVPVDLVARGVLDLDRVPAGHARAGLAMGPQPGLAQLAGEGRVAAAIAELDHLVIRRARPHVWVIGDWYTL